MVMSTNVASEPSKQKNADAVQRQKAVDKMVVAAKQHMQKWERLEESYRESLNMVAECAVDFKNFLSEEAQKGYHHYCHIDVFFLGRDVPHLFFIFLLGSPPVYFNFILHYVYITTQFSRIGFSPICYYLFYNTFSFHPL